MNRIELLNTFACDYVQQSGNDFADPLNEISHHLYLDITINKRLKSQTGIQHFGNSSDLGDLLKSG